jgi:hypothetical protein
MTDMQRDALFPSPEGSEADRQKEATTGLLPSQMLREAVALGREILSPQPIGDDQIQPGQHRSAPGRGGLPRARQLSARSPGKRA